MSHIGNILVPNSTHLKMGKETEVLGTRILEWRNKMAEEEAVFAVLMLVIEDWRTKAKEEVYG